MPVSASCQQGWWASSQPPDQGSTFPKYTLGYVLFLRVSIRVLQAAPGPCQPLLP